MNEVNLIFEYLNEKQSTGTILDIGAHFGSSSRPFLEEDWHVYAFEPDNQNRQKLLILDQDFPKLKIDPRAVSKSAIEAASFFTSEVSTGISTLEPFHDSHKASQTVEVTTLESICNENKINKIDFLKIDTEGHDLFVLEGNNWEQIEPSVILCEFEDRKTVPLGYSFHDLAKFLQNKGYKVIVSEWLPIIEYGLEHQWNRFFDYSQSEDLSHKQSWGNILAFKDDVDPKSFNRALVKAQKNELERPRFDDPQIIKYLNKQWQKIKNQSTGNLYLYGAGKHTRKLSCSLKNFSLDDITAVIDDSIEHEESFYGIKKIPLTSLTLNKEDRIILSTDRFQKEMLQQCEKFLGSQESCIDLYYDFPN